MGHTFAIFFEAGSHHIAKDTLKFIILLPQPTKCWDYEIAFLFGCHFSFDILDNLMHLYNVF